MKRHIKLTILEIQVLKWMRKEKDRFVINTDRKHISPLLKKPKSFSSILGHLSRKELVAQEWVNHGKPCCVGYYLTDLKKK